ncbi:hypothetical protein TcYC6_0051600 [Trypanosoma cruzi]|nr:hypothetical protein TcYC6_0051600 [Trypanosoma cruzi]
MWSLIKDVRGTVRQAVAPRKERSNEELRSHDERQQPLSSGLAGVGDFLSGWWDTINKKTKSFLQDALGTSDIDAYDEPLPLLLRLTPEQREAMHVDEIIREISEAVSVIAIRSDRVHREACFLLSLSLEEQIAHTSDFINCYDWWEKLVNRRLSSCQEILHHCQCPPESEESHTICLLTQRIHSIREKCTQDMATIASRGRILRDERYDFLEKIPCGDQTKETTYKRHQVKKTGITEESISRISQHDEFNKEDMLRQLTDKRIPKEGNKLRKTTNNHTNSTNTKEEAHIFFQEEAEARRLAEEESRRLAEEAESRRLAEEARRLAEEAEARRLAEEAEARRLAEEAESRRLAEEAESHRLAEEAEARRLAEEAESRRLAEEAEARRLAEEAESHRLAEEAEARRLAEEAEARRLAEEAEARRLAEEARRLAEEAESRRLAEEAESHRLAEEAEARRLAEEAEARRLAEEAESRRLAEEAEARRLAEEAEARRLAEEAEARRLAEEAEARRLAEEAEARRLAEEARRLAEEAEARRLAEEARRLAEEAESHRLAEEAESRRLAEEAESRRLAEEARRLAEEAESRRLAEEAEARRLAEEAEACRLAEEAEARRLAEEAESHRLAEEAESRRLAEEQSRRLAEEAESRRLAEEAESHRLAEEAESRRLAEEAESRRLAEEQSRRLAEEAESRRLAEEEKARFLAGAEDVSGGEVYGVNLTFMNFLLLPENSSFLEREESIKRMRIVRLEQDDYLILFRGLMLASANFSDLREATEPVKAETDSGWNDDDFDEDEMQFSNLCGANLASSTSVGGLQMEEADDDEWGDW